MEVYPEKMGGTPHHARSAVYRPFFSGYTPIHHKIIIAIPFDANLKMLQSTSVINVDNGVSNGELTI